MDTIICLYKGRRGTGKTLNMVYDANKYYHGGWRIISNFKISFGELVSNEFILNLDKNSDLKNCILVIDEIQILFDSRNFTNASNKKFSNFIQQLRKRNINILCTAQYTNTIDLRLRQHVDVLVFPKLNKITGVCTSRYFDLTTLEDEETKNVIPTTVTFYAPPFYKMYDTREIIA